MNFDTMCRAGAAGRITMMKAAADILGVPETQLRVGNSQVGDTKSGKRLSFAQIVQSGQGEQDLDGRRAQGDQAEKP